MEKLKEGMTRVRKVFKDLEAKHGLNGKKISTPPPALDPKPLARKKKTNADFYKMKEKGEKVAWITSYTAPQGRFAEAAGIDMILVGDSGGMCILGYENTIPVTMEESMMMTKAVRRGAPNTYIVGDMPFMSYQVSVADAVANAGRFIKEAGADAIKLEGGVCCKEQIRAIVDAGICVFGHIGMTPQSSGIQGVLAQGRDVPAARAVIQDAFAVQEAGAHYLLVEAIPPELGHYISSQLDIPVYGIGGGWALDGQLLIIADLLGEFQAFTPKFVKKYCSISGSSTKALESYVQDVKSQKFPLDEHCYHVKKDQEKGIAALFKEMAKKPEKVTDLPPPGPAAAVDKVMGA
jgi:3-methyl-2-oxobutanoate hydroxymethyltransferase